MPKVKKWKWQLVETDEEIEVPDRVAPIAPIAMAAPAPVAERVHTAAAWLPAEFAPNKPERADAAALDHPYIGGRLTVFALTWGDNLHLIQRCIESVIRNAPVERLDIRIGANQVSPRVRTWLDAFDPSLVTKIYYDDGDRRKYTCMREMFYDKAHPITTNYLLWFDDDSHVIDPKWLIKLARDIKENHAHGVRMYGPKMIHDLAMYIKKGFAPQKWFQAAPWWRNKPLHVNKGFSTAPNGTQILFCSGGFWALHVPAMREAQIPDTRLSHNGGDITLGAQLYQAGYKIKDFSQKKEIVRWSDAPRRGYHEPFQWAALK